jgi:hypothetical protein
MSARVAPLLVQAGGEGLSGLPGVTAFAGDSIGRPLPPALRAPEAGNKLRHLLDLS